VTDAVQNPRRVLQAARGFGQPESARPDDSEAASNPCVHACRKPTESTLAETVPRGQDDLRISEFGERTAHGSEAATILPDCFIVEWLQKRDDRADLLHGSARGMNTRRSLLVQLFNRLSELATYDARQLAIRDVT
jgi:hypothetical protein